MNTAVQITTLINAFFSLVLLILLIILILKIMKVVKVIRNGLRSVETLFNEAKHLGENFRCRVHELNESLENLACTVRGIKEGLKVGVESFFKKLFRSRHG